MTRTAGRLLRVHMGENDRYRGRPLHEEVVARCRAAGADMAVVYRGVEGYGASTLVRRRGLFGRSSDAPIVVTILAVEEAMQALEPALDEIVDEGLIAASTIEIIRFERRDPA
ncbi:MAG: DUF190 domain-containing protein [Terriglobales bacterium]